MGLQQRRHRRRRFRGRHFVQGWRRRGTPYRLQYRLVTRLLWTLMLFVTVAFFSQVAVSSDVGFWWRLVSIVSVVSAFAGVRVLWGAAVIAGPDGLRIYRPCWPFSRDLAWYRILATDIIPGFWFVELEMNSGERIELPSVEHMDDLYEQIEAYRARLDVAG